MNEGPEKAAPGMRTRIAALLRTNVALFLLCVIAAGIAYMAVRPGGGRTASHAPTVSSDAPDGSYSIAPAAGSPAAGSGPSVGAAPALRPELKDMPAPSTYEHFKPEAGKSLTVSGTCSDAYRVMMIFPADADYRADPARANYNSATACSAGTAYSDVIPFDSLRLSPDTEYYVIRADAGASGDWYGPR